MPTSGETSTRASAEFDAAYYHRQYAGRPWRRRGDRPILYRSLARAIRRYQRSGPLLDVGCGEGAWLARAAQHFDVYGIDLSTAAVEEARRRTGASTIVSGSATALPHSSRTFAVVTALDVVEHLPDPGPLFVEAHRVLRPGGLLVLSTPNVDSLGHRLRGNDSFIYRDPTHVSVEPPDRWRELLSAAGLSVVAQGTDTLWDVPYVRWVPARLQWAIFIGLAQSAWLFRPMFPWRLGENYWCFARRRP